MGILEQIAKRPPSKFTPLPRVPYVPVQEPPQLVQDVPIFKKIGVLDFLRTEYRRQLDPSNRWRFFSEKSPEYAPAGSVLTVSYQENKTSSRIARFTGILMAIRRQVATPTIMLRGIVDGVAVEQVFQVFSPLIRSIAIDKRATVLKGRKLYWIREQPQAWVAKLTQPEPTFLNDQTQVREPLQTQSRIPERLHDVIIRGPQAVKFDRRRGVACYPKKKIVKRKK